MIVWEVGRVEILVRRNGTWWDGLTVLEASFGMGRDSRSIISGGCGSEEEEEEEGDIAGAGVVGVARLSGGGEISLFREASLRRRWAVSRRKSAAAVLLEAELPASTV